VEAGGSTCIATTQEIHLSPVAEFKDPVFAITTPKRSFLVIINELFGLVFAKTGSINSGTGSLQYRIPVAAIQGSLKALLAALHKHF
jgi:hypothetical protein